MLAPCATPPSVRPIEGLSQRTVDGKLRLNIHGFLELVLKNSTDVNITRLDVYTAADQITAAKSPLDPLLKGSFQDLRSTQQSFTQISGAATLSQHSQLSALSYQELFPTGQTVVGSFNTDREITNSSFVDLYNPYTNSIFNIQITQPLLQDRNRIEFKGPIEIARTQLLITSDKSAALIADTVANAAGQYWEAVRARDFIKVQQQTLDLAQKSYDRDKQALDLGAIASLDIFQSETQVAERRRDLIQAQYDYRIGLDALRRLIGADLTPEIRNTEIVLEDDPSVLPPKTSLLPFEDALAAALKVRPELSAAGRQVTVDDLNARIARNLLLPRLDLSVQGSGNGLSGTGVPPAPSAGFGNSLGQVFGYTYPTYGGQVQFSTPIRNSAARAQLSDALVNRTRDQYTQRQVRQQVTLDVRQAINSLELADATIQAATRARDLARQNVSAEQQKYELGTITAFEVLDSQNRLASAENALLVAFVGYQEAFISYQRATWTLLDGLGMVLEVPRVR